MFSLSLDTEIEKNKRKTKESLIKLIQKKECLPYHPIWVVYSGRGLNDLAASTLQDIRREIKVRRKEIAAMTTNPKWDFLLLSLQTDLSIPQRYDQLLVGVVDNLTDWRNNILRKTLNSFSYLLNRNLCYPNQTNWADQNALHAVTLLKDAFQVSVTFLPVWLV